MKTIAISIDEPTLRALDRLSGNKKGERGNRSGIVRVALQEFLARRAKLERETAERKIWAAHIKRINSQAAALIADQADA